MKKILLNIIQGGESELQEREDSERNRKRTEGRKKGVS